MGTVLSFTTGDRETSRRLVEALTLFPIAVSFGSLQSTIGMPCAMSHASIPPEDRHLLALSEDLIRISCGIEEAEDLVEDLRMALDTIQESLLHVT